MTVNRSVWNRLFDQNSFPGLPCPECETGKLKLDADSFAISEPPFSRSSHSHEDFEPDWVEQRFIARLVCDEKKCGEIVAMAGDTELVEMYSDDEEEYKGWYLASVLRPRCVFPAPPLFRIPKGVPQAVRRELLISFQLFWTDLSSCISRLRTSIEAMLDQQGVPTTKLNIETGKTSRLDLYARIKAFEQQVSGAEAADALQALRNVGNLGTHGNSITPEATFDAFDVMEDVLLGVYEKQSIKAKANNLKGLKG